MTSPSHVHFREANGKVSDQLQVPISTCSSRARCAPGVFQVCRSCSPRLGFSSAVFSAGQVSPYANRRVTMFLHPVLNPFRAHTACLGHCPPASLFSASRVLLPSTPGAAGLRSGSSWWSRSWRVGWFCPGWRVLPGVCKVLGSMGQRPTCRADSPIC